MRHAFQNCVPKNRERVPSKKRIESWNKRLWTILWTELNWDKLPKSDPRANQRSSGESRKRDPKKNDVLAKEWNESRSRKQSSVQAVERRQEKRIPKERRKNPKICACIWTFNCYYDRNSPLEIEKRRQRNSRKGEQIKESSGESCKRDPQTNRKT